MVSNITTQNIRVNPDSTTAGYWINEKQGGIRNIRHLFTISIDVATMSTYCLPQPSTHEALHDC